MLQHSGDPRRDRAVGGGSFIPPLHKVLVKRIENHEPKVAVLPKLFDCINLSIGMDCLNYVRW
jgi:hypothetical protein